MSHFDLSGLTALISGASSGIGAGVALAFGAAGAKVAINFPSSDQAQAAEAVVAEIVGTGGQAQAFQADVSEPDQVEAMVAKAEADLGPIDILINNAGIAHSAPLQDIPIEMWDRLMAVHLRSVFLVTRAVLPGMYARGSGRIINTASQLAKKGAAGFTHYTAAKGAIISLTRSLALEAANSGVTVNAVAPGATHTPMLADVPEDVLDGIRADIPRGCLAEVDDIVPSYLFLASAAGRHYQGQTISPNGGDIFF